MSIFIKQNLSTNVNKWGGNINDLLKAKIKHALIDKGWRYKDLAKAVGVTEKTMCTFMSKPAREMPSLEAKVRKVLNLD